MEYTGIAPN